MSAYETDLKKDEIRQIEKGIVTNQMGLRSWEMDGFGSEFIPMMMIMGMKP